MRRWTMKLVVAAMLAACGGDDEAVAVDAAVAGDAPEVVDAPVCGTPRTVFLNRGGGTYTRGDDDSSTNTTIIVQQETTVAAPTIAPADWTAFRTCLESKYAPFNVSFTEQDPGAAEHTELVVISRARDIGLSSGIYGISPFACAAGGGPRLYERGITFIMWDELPATGERCWGAAQTLGNSFGLDHAFSCPDLQSALTGCGPVENKTFTDADVPCGAFEARACTCTGATQNSFRHLTQTLGPACD